MSLVISRLGHTWLIDLDGTVLGHNGHLIDGDRLAPGVREFWEGIPERDVIVLLSARDDIYREATLSFLKDSGLRFNEALFGLPTGERILINDRKPSGLATALAINIERDAGFRDIAITIDGAL